MHELPQDKKIILFDGVCNLCNTSVHYIIKHDKKDIFRFVPLQSEIGKKIINSIGLNNKIIDSIVLYEPLNTIYFIKASAGIRILINLGGVYTLGKIALIIPRFISNFIYDFIAINRYRWYGKKESCLLPTAANKAKFLS